MSITKVTGPVVDPTVAAAGVADGDMAYFDGTSWIILPKATNIGDRLERGLLNIPQWRPRDFERTLVTGTETEIIFTSLFSADFDVYEIDFSLRPGTDDVELRMEVSQDGGSTWRTEVGDYHFMQEGRRDQSSTVSTQNASQTHMSITGEQAGSLGVGTGTGEGISGNVRIFNPNSTVINKHFYWNYFCTNANVGEGHMANGGGSFQGNQLAIDGVRMYWEGDATMDGYATMRRIQQ